jgi:hypothetical protein
MIVRPPAAWVTAASAASAIEFGDGYPVAIDGFGGEVEWAWSAAATAVPLISGIPDAPAESSGVRRGGVESEGDGSIGVSPEESGVGPAEVAAGEIGPDAGLIAS